MCPNCRWSVIGRRPGVGTVLGFLCDRSFDGWTELAATQPEHTHRPHCTVWQIENATEGMCDEQGRPLLRSALGGTVPADVTWPGSHEKGEVH